MKLRLVQVMAAFLVIMSAVPLIMSNILSTTVVHAAVQCSDTVHAGYSNGWHPMIHPATGCYFGHEHGNDPTSAIPGLTVHFNHAGTENHHGFKVFAFTDEMTTPDSNVVIVMHQGTSGRNVLCSQFHEVQIYVSQEDTLKLHYTLMADFGKSRFAATSTNMAPPECPNQGSINSQGIRRVPDSPDGYTPYLVNQSAAALGLRLRASFLTTDGIDGCDDYVCATMARNSTNTGSRRRLQSLNDDFNVGIDVSAPNSGTFYTDATGQTAVSSGTPGAVQQFRAAGFTWKMMSAESQRLSNGSNGLWYYNGQSGKMEAVADGNSGNGANPLLPVAEFGGNN